MNEVEVRNALEDAGAILHGHFKLSSGMHSDTYVQCARVLENPRIAHQLAGALAEKLTRHHGPIGTVAAPALGALLIGYAVAFQLDARFIFAERTDGAMAFRRGQHVSAGETMVVIEDAITTGGSAKEVADLIESAGGVVLGAGSIVDRSGGRAPFTLDSLVTVEARADLPQDCPQCAAGAPITSPGSRYAKPRYGEKSSRRHQVAEAGEPA
ncbi:MAG: orotate phosphoribosyltransferase [Actinomycetota bacterium]